MSEKKVELSIHDKEEPKPLPQLKLFLKQSGDNVDLCSKDSEGFIWSILSIQSDGKFGRYTNIDPKTGLQVNKNGQIVEAK